MDNLTVAQLYTMIDDLRDRVIALENSRHLNQDIRTHLETSLLSLQNGQAEQLSSIKQSVERLRKDIVDIQTILYSSYEVMKMVIK